MPSLKPAGQSCKTQNNGNVLGMFWERFGNTLPHPVQLTQPSFPDRDVQIFCLLVKPVLTNIC